MTSQQYVVQYGDANVPTPPAYVRASSTATTAMTLGIISIFVLGPFLGIPAMVLAHNAKKEIVASNGWVTGLGQARAGFWTGLVGSTWVFLLVLMIFVFGAALGLGQA